jgi:hypothetical protein
MNHRMQTTERGVHAASTKERGWASSLLPPANFMATLKRAEARAPLALVVALLTSACSAQQPTVPPRGVQITQSTNSLRIEINGQLFTDYRFGQSEPRPYFYPLFGPGGAGMTRNWPMKDTPGEEHDHVHHRGLWYTQGKVNGVDFWTEGPTKGRIVHRGFDEIKSGADSGVVKSRNDWVAADGKVICTDQRVFRVYARPDHERLFDFEITFHASHGEVTLGDTKEAAMAMRVAETMRVTKQTPRGQKPIPGDGRIVTSEGALNQDAWGKRAAWCDYSGPVDGRTLGIAIFDHPSNPKHPTWWMVRDYGLFAANPLGQHEFEKTSDPRSGDIVIPAGKSVTFRYRFFVHEGDEKQARVAECFAEYVKTK